MNDVLPRAPSFTPIVQRVADIVPRPIRWLWKHYVPLGAVTVLQGDPGLGKSSILADLAARVTRGARAPLSEVPMAAGAVLMLTSEDSHAAVLRPRLEAAGADAARVLVMTEVLSTCDGRPRHVALSEHLGAIEAACAEHDVRLLIVDPVMSFIGGGIDAYSDYGVRQVLDGLAPLAQRLDLAVVLVRHFTKSRNGTAMHHGSGSIAFSGLARSVLEVDETKTGRVLASVKRNYGPAPPPVAYGFVEVPGPFDQPVGRVQWIGAPAARPAEPSPLERALVFLNAQFADGPVPAAEVRSAAGARGISGRTLGAAKKELGVRSARAAHSWWWLLPGQVLLPGAGKKNNNLSAKGGERLPSSAETHVEQGLRDAQTGRCFTTPVRSGVSPA